MYVKYSKSILLIREVLFKNERIRNHKTEEGIGPQTRTTQRRERRPSAHSRTTCLDPSRNFYLTQQRDTFYSELVLNRQTIEKVETIMAQKMK